MRKYVARSRILNLNNPNPNLLLLNQNSKLLFGPNIDLRTYVTCIPLTVEKHDTELPSVLVRLRLCISTPSLDLHLYVPQARETKKISKQLNQDLLSAASGEPSFS